jgi:hypothetical protein
MEEIRIALEKQAGSVQAYEEADSNLARVTAILASGETIPSATSRVVLALSRDAMVGLGTELLRAAHVDPELEPGKHWHIDPIRRDAATQCMGLYLHPSSCELIIQHEDLGTIENAMAEARKGDWE